MGWAALFPKRWRTRRPGVRVGRPSVCRTYGISDANRASWCGDNYHRGGCQAESHRLSRSHAACKRERCACRVRRHGYAGPAYTEATSSWGGQGTCASCSQADGMARCGLDHGPRHRLGRRAGGHSASARGHSTHTRRHWHASTTSTRVSSSAGVIRRSSDRARGTRALASGNQQPPRCNRNGAATRNGAHNPRHFRRQRHGGGRECARRGGVRRDSASQGHLQRPVIGATQAGASCRRHICRALRVHGAISESGAVTTMAAPERQGLRARDRRAITLGAIVLVMVLGYAKIIRPLRTDIAHDREALHEQRGLLARERALIARAPTLPAARRDVEQALSAEQTRLFSGDSVAATSELSGFVADVARATGVTLTSLEGRAPAGAGGIYRIGADLRGEGAWRQVLTFIRALESSSRLIEVTSIRIERGPRGGPLGGAALLLTASITGYARGGR